jgi:monoamine oxidase
MAESVDVAVVGAGLAGLSAAEALAGSGCSVRVLEADDHVGGRTLNHDLGDGKVVELGGQWIGPTQFRLRELAARTGTDIYPTYDAGKHVAVFDGVRSTYRQVPRLSPAGLVESGLTLARLERLARRIEVEEPWSSGNRLDQETVAGWMRRHVHTRTARTMMELLVENVFTCSPADLSVLHMLATVQSAGGFRPLLGIRGGAADSRFVGGSQVLSQRLAASLGSENVSLNAPVRRIGQVADRVTLSADGATVAARYAIVTIPPALAGRIIYQPRLPSDRDQLTLRAPMGSVIKCLAIYDEPFWRPEGYNGQAVADHQVAVRATFDNSPPDGRPGILVAFLAGNNARGMARIDAADRRRAVLDSLVTFFGSRAAKPRDYVEMDWSTREWILGCYGAHFGPGVWSAYGRALRTPVGRLHWAGTETATEWIGYMEGAVQSGQRAAQEVIRRL